MNLPEPIGQAALAFFQRLLGPVGEAGEFLTDKIRFYRWKSSMKTLQRAREVARQYNLEVKEVPLKFLVPFMEKSSLEDEDSEMTHRWANLLAGAMSGNHEANIPLIDILSKLGPQEVKILENLISVKLATRFLELPDPLGHYSVNNFATRFATSSSMPDFFSTIGPDSDPKFVESVCSSFMSVEEGRDFFVEAIEYSINTEGEDISGIVPNDKVISRLLSFELLHSLSLMTRSTFIHRGEDIYLAMTIITPTALAFEFVTACRGDRLSQTKQAVAGDSSTASGDAPGSAEA